MARARAAASGGKERDLWIEMRPLSSFKRARRNPKSHDAESIGSSLGRFGMVEVPVVNERTDRLVAGHGRIERLQADKDAGRAPPSRVRLRAKDGEWLVPVLRGVSFKDDREAEAYLLASNQTTISGGWESAELASLLADLSRSGDDALVGTGFSDDEVARIIASAGASALGALSGGGGDGGDVEYDGDESYTPEPYVEGARTVLGGIDLDPFTCAVAQARVRAARFFTKEQDGLEQQWSGRIWFQPPYSQPTIARAVAKLVETLEGDRKVSVVGLVNAAVDTAWWQVLARRADLVCVHAGRIGFDQPDGRGGVVQTDNNRYSQTSFYVGPKPDLFRATFERWGVVGKLG